MNRQLKDLLDERADRPDFALPDVDVLVGLGDRRRRRTRLATGAGAIALVAAVAVPTVLLVGGSDGGATDVPGPADGPAPGAGPFPRGPLTWAEGDVIHYGDQVLEVGAPIDAFVQTGYGFVVASDGDVLAVDADGTTKVGQVDAEDPVLVSDEDGSLAGWRQRGSAATVATYDTAGQVSSAAVGKGGTGDEVGVYALDDGDLYWHDSRGVVRTEIATGRTRVLQRDADPGLDLYDVEAGLVASRPTEGAQVAIGPTLDAAPLPGPRWVGGVLSPDGRHFAPDAADTADAATVVDSTSGEDLALDTSDYSCSAGYAWLDDATLAVVAQTPDGAGQPCASAELLACDIVTGTCAVGARPDPQTPVVLPTGARP